MPIMLNSVNGLNNGSNRFKRAADPRFTRLVNLVSGGQLADTVQIRSSNESKVPKAQ